MSKQALASEEDLSFNPLSPDFIRDPYPYYHRLREKAPLYMTPLGFRVATRYADVASILRDRRFGKDFEGRIERQRGPEIWNEPAVRGMRRFMLVLNPPDHTRLRGLVVKAFTARRVEEMRPRIESLVDELLDQIEPNGEADLIKDFAYPLPVNVICDMMGIPDEDRPLFLEGSRVSGRLLDPIPLSREEMDRANEGQHFITEYFRALFERRRREPTDDLTTHLVQAEEAGDRLSEEELTANVILLFNAGHETTVNLIGNGLLALFRNPDQLRRLRDDPGLMPSAIEELLRYDSSVQMTSRTAFEDVDVGGVTVAKGETVMTLLGAANRDPAVFTDPDRLDVARDEEKPLSFGGGIHYCLGAQLARIEGEVAVRKILERLPAMRIENLENPSWRQTFTLRGLTALPARW